MVVARRSFLHALVALGCGGAMSACTLRGSDEAGGDGSEVPVRDGAPIDLGGGVTRRRISYADHADAFGDLWLPAGADPAPVVVLVHGGFWRERFRLDLMDGLARSLVDEGYAAWNIEYRRVGAGGGWPETFVDVAAAVDHLAADDAAERLDLARVATVGHSAGGHLAVWLASRGELGSGVVGADPVVRPVLAVSQAGVLDLVGAATDRVGDTAVTDLLGGGPADLPERYAQTSPLALAPIDVPVVAVHGTDDTIVPPAQSQRYVDAARTAGGDAELVEVDGADHFDVIDPTHESWRVVLDTLATRLRGSG